jgi:lysozyme family protein
MGDFKTSWAKTSKNEAGYANNSKDAGKETWRGISIVHNPDFAGWPIIHKTIAALGITDTLDCSAELLKRIDKALFAIPELDALTGEMYKRKYWDPLNLDNEPDQSICDTTFDSAVLMGVGTEKKSIDKARQEADEIV